MADDDLGTAVVDELVDPGAEQVADATDTTAAAASATDQPETTAAAIESFINPADLPEEIKPHWKRMHAAYTKWIEKERNPARADTEMLKRFRTDEAFATEVIRLEAQRRGLHLAPANGTTTPATAEPTARQDGEAPSPQLVAAIKAKLDPSLHWMADSLAAAGMEAAKIATRPLVDKDRAKDQAARDTEWGALAGKLTETAPGWEAHEADMSELSDWLKSPSLTHARFGDKLTFLYNAVTNGSAAKADAIRAMGDAARNATRTGQSSRASVPNVTDRVRKATTARDAMKIAAEEAERELRAAGVAVPD